METQGRKRLHPMIAIAAFALIVFSMVGIAAFTGNLPGTSAQAPQGQPQLQASAQPQTQSQPKATAQPAPRAAVKPTAKSCVDCGVVVEVKEIEIKGEGSGIGAVAGGVVGAVVGNQFGHGDGRKIMTVAGAAGGALAGNEIEKQARAQKRYDVAVRMGDGSTRTVSMQAQPTWRSGDRVRVANGTLQPL